MRIKKTMSKIIAYLLLFNFVFTDLNNFIILKANSLVLNANVERVLLPGLNNVKPFLGKNNSDDEMLFWWDFAQMGESKVSDGTFTLSYFTKDRTRSEFIVKKNNKTAEVSYKLYDSPVGGPENPISLKKYKIHTNLNRDGGPGFIEAKDFIDNSHISPSDDYKVLTANTPRFIIRKETGFSFQADGKDIHFLWGDDDKFYVSHDSMEKGKVYDVNLNYTNRDKDWDSKKKVTTGISSYTFRAIPIANDGNTVINGNNFDLDGHLLQQNGGDLNTDILDLTYPNTAELPASQKVELVLAFDTPKELDPATNLYTKIPSGYEMPVNLKLGFQNELDGMRIKIKDLLSGSYNIGSDIDISNGGIINKYRKVNAEGRMEVRIEDLEPGIIYNPVEITVDTPVITAGATSIPFQKVFTFMEYKVVFIDGDFHIQVEPYEGYPGYYMLKSGDTLQETALKKSDGKSPVLFPISVSFENNHTEKYQVFFSVEKEFNENGMENAVYSQIIKFSPTGTDLQVGSPKNFEIEDDYKLIYDEEVPDGKSAMLDMFAKWDVGSKSIIEQMIADNGGSLVIDYDLFNTINPDKEDVKKEKFVTVKSTLSIENGKIYAVYSDAEGKVINTEKEELTIRVDAGSGNEILVSRVNLLVKALHINETMPTGEDIQFRFPNIYFINAKVTKVNGVEVDLPASNYDTVTLNDMSEMELNPPQNLSITDVTTLSKDKEDPKDEVSFKFNFDIPSMKLKKYYENSLPHSNANFDVKLNLYITQNEANARDSFSKYSYEERIAKSEKVEYKDEYNKDLYFSEISGNIPMQINGFEDPRAALRKDKVVRIDSIHLTAEQVQEILESGSAISLSYKFDGLDKNQRYFLMADLVATHTNSSGEVVKETASSLSNIVAGLTKGDKEEIDDTDKTPPSPEIEVTEIGLDNATVEWKKVHSYDPTGEKESIEYELIRLKDARFSEELKLTKDDFNTTYKNSILGKDKVGLRTNKFVIEKYNGSSFSEASKKEFEYDPTEEKIKLIDKTLNPNEVYFYYARTVRIVGDKKIYSTWSDASATTNIIQGPINLKIVKDKLTFDPKTEVIIEFDAPITELDKLGKEFFLEYAIKRDNEDFEKPVRMDSKLLKDNATKDDAPEGHTKFVYRLTKLKTGAYYEIKVRMVDSNKNESVYSNSVTTRSEVDQEDLDNEQEANEWEIFLQQNLEKFYKRDYWTISDSQDKFEVIYRPTMFNKVLAETTGRVVELPAGKSQNKTYYFPASALLDLSNQEKGLMIRHENMEILLNKDTINEDTNEAIREVKEKIKQNSLVDYYVKITTNFSKSQNYIEGNEPLGYEVDVNISIVGSMRNNTEWDKLIYNSILEKVEKEIEARGVTKKLDEMIKFNDSAELILKYLNEDAEDAYTHYEKFIEKEFDSVKKNSFKLNKLDANLTIAIKGMNATDIVKGYKKESGTYTGQNTIPYGDGKAMLVLEPGIYAFVGTQIKIAELNNIENGEKYKMLLIKYDLLDFFGKDITTLQYPATKNMVVGSSARMIGAPKGVDNIKFLAEKGANINSRNLHKNISEQETINILMTLYESRTNTKLSTVQIKNHASISKIKGIEDKYKTSMKVAFEIGLVSDEYMNPNENITIQRLLEMLLVLDY